MASIQQGFMFGEFGDLSPEEHERIFNILHGNRRESGSKVEFPWDGEEELSGAVGGTTYGDRSWANEAVDIGYPDNSYQGSISEGAQFSFMSNEPHFGNYSNTVTMADSRNQIPSNKQHYSDRDQGQYMEQGEQYLGSNSGSAGDRDQFDSEENSQNYGTAGEQNDPYYGDKSGNSSKLQASLKPYERRNKKKRPPGYYKQPEDHSQPGRMQEFHPVQPDLTQPPPNFHPDMRFSMPPPGINPNQFVANNSVRYGDSNFPNPAQMQNFPAGVPLPAQGAFPRFGSPVILQRNNENIPNNQRQEPGDLCEVVIDTIPPASSVNIPTRHETFQVQNHERTNPQYLLNDSRVNDCHAHSIENRELDSNMQRDSVAKPTRVDVSVKDALVDEDSSHTYLKSEENNVQEPTHENTYDNSIKDNIETDACVAEKSNRTENYSVRENLIVKKDTVQKNSGDNIVNSLPEQDESYLIPEETDKKQEQVKSKPTSWAGLFKSNTNNSYPVNHEAPVVNNVSSNSSANVEAEQRSEKELSPLPVPASEDSVAKELGELLLKMTISHASVSLQPRGLVNRANWCYIHGTLQALVACPPFYNLLKKLPRYPAISRGPSSTPILDALVEFVHEFQPMSRNFERGQKGVKDITPGAAFEPTYVYKMLQAIAVNPHFKHGKQEDAEEFLSCVLDGMHEEMSAAVSLNSDLVDNQETEEMEDGYVNGFVHAEGEVMEEETGDNWEQVGPKKKSVLTRRANFAKTPISEIFAGMVRSAVYKSTTKETATLEPFFTLQLDIQSEKVWNVKDALEGFVSKEQISGYNCPKTNTEVEVMKKLSLEELPPVLILHLKCFVYDKDGGSQKVLKKVDYSIELEITKDLLSPNARSKLTAQQRTYKLFAVVYHIGKKATGGHYTTSVFHPGINGWIYIDDSTVKTVPAATVLKHSPPRVPYLLYYRRLDSH